MKPYNKENKLYERVIVWDKEPSIESFGLVLIGLLFLIIGFSLSELNDIIRYFFSFFIGVWSFWAIQESLGRNRRVLLRELK